MKEPFCHLKGKNRKGQTAQIGHPHIPWDDGGPQMIQQHEPQSQQAQRHGIQAAKGLLIYR